VGGGQQRPELRGVQTTFTTSVPQYASDVDRDKARALAFHQHHLRHPCRARSAACMSTDFSLFGRTYRVSLSSEPTSARSGRHAACLRAFRTTRHVPLSELVDLHARSRPDAVDRFKHFPAAKVIAPGAGYSSGQAIAAMQDVLARPCRATSPSAGSATAYKELATAARGSSVSCSA